MNLLDLFFPKGIYCPSCERPLPPWSGEGAAFCKSCMDSITWVKGRICAKCGRALSGENHTDLCFDCQMSGERHFGRGYACALYTGRAAEIVRSVKYQGNAWIAEAVAQVMAERYFSEADAETGEIPMYDGIVAVPMATGKKEIRGYDQAALLARWVSRRTTIPFLQGALTRTRETPVMSGLSQEERRQNLTGAFAASYDMMKQGIGKRLLLVDDVYTTGSSVDACAEKLLDAGAQTVDILVFAIGADVRRAEDRPAVVESPGQLRAKGPT